MQEIATGQATRKAPSRLPQLSPQTAALGESYDGPVFVVTSDALAPENGHVPIHAGDLLSTVRKMDVPLVYVPSSTTPVDAAGLPQGDTVSPQDVKAAGGLKAYLQTLSSEMPKAHVFTLGSNLGNDGQATGLPGMTNYLRNADPRQKRMPVGFQGTLTDEYFDEFSAKVAGDLAGAKQCSASLGGNPALKSTLPEVPFLPAAPPIGMAAPHQMARVQVAATDVVNMVAASVRRRLQDTQASLQLAGAPLASLGSTPRLALGQALFDVMRSNSPQANDMIYNVLTSHGTRPGQIDSILSVTRHPVDIEKALYGQNQWSMDALRSQGAARPGDWAGFNQYMDDLTGTKVRPNVGVQVHVNGDQAFPKMIDAIKNAKSFINLTTFAFESDQTGREVLAALEDAAARGVKINLLVDPTGSAKTYRAYTSDATMFDKLKTYSNVQFIQTPHSPLSDHCNHRKITTMDNGQGDGGQIGFTGGMNIGNEYRIRWHDVNTEITGTAVTDLNRLMIDQIRHFGGKVDPALEAEMNAPQKEVRDGYNVRVVGHVGGQDHDLKLAYLRAINTAKDSIDIADPFLSDPDIFEALQARARAGVKVRLVVPEQNDPFVMKWSARAHYNDLIAAGVEVYEYDGREMAHDKVAVFDKKITTIGSCNLDARSLNMNDEDNIWSDDARLAQEVTRRLFDADVQTAKRITSYNPTLITRSEDTLTRIFKNWL